MHQEDQGASASPQREWAAPVGTLDWHWRIAHRFLLLSCAVPICWENQPSQRSSNIGNSRINLKPLDDTLLNTMVPCNLLWYLHDSKIPFATSPEVSNPAMLQRSVHGQMGCISFVTQMNRLDVFNTKTASGVTCGVYESTSYMWVVKLLSSSQTDTKHTVSIKNDEFFPSGLKTCWKEVPTPPLSFFPSSPGTPGRPLPLPHAQFRPDRRPRNLSVKNLHQVGLLTIPPSKQTTSWKGTPIRATQDC